MCQKIIIGLPAFNEERNIGRLLEKIQSLSSSFEDRLHVIAVNDGSTDGTEAILKKYAGQHGYIRYLNHARNLGLGAAMKTLLQYAVLNFDDQDALITFDADNTHNPSIIPSMIDYLNEEDLDIVIASRFAKGGCEIGLSKTRKLYSRGAMVFCRLVFHLKNIKDYSCGYRAYKIGFLKKLMLAYGGNVVNASGFECMVEILAKAGRIGGKVGEYPLVLEYNLKKGKSKMKVTKTIMGYIKLAVSVRKPHTKIGA